MLTVTSNSHYLHAKTMRCALQAVVAGRRLDQLEVPVQFPDCAVLQCLYAWFYRRLYHINPTAAVRLGDPANVRRILKTILNADEMRMAEQVEVDPGLIDDGWSESSATASRGVTICVREGDYTDCYGQTYADQTCFKLDSNGCRIRLAQIASELSPNVENHACEMEISLKDLKRHCLQAYMDSFTAENQQPDLREIYLERVDTTGLDLSAAILPGTRPVALFSV